MCTSTYVPSYPGEWDLAFEIGIGEDIQEWVTYTEQANNGLGRIICVWSQETLLYDCDEGVNATVPDSCDGQELGILFTFHNITTEYESTIDVYPYGGGGSYELHEVFDDFYSKVVGHIQACGEHAFPEAVMDNNASGGSESDAGVDSGVDVDSIASEDSDVDMESESDASGNM